MTGAHIFAEQLILVLDDAPGRDADRDDLILGLKGAVTDCVADVPRHTYTYKKLI